MNAQSFLKVTISMAKLQRSLKMTYDLVDKLSNHLLKSGQETNWCTLKQSRSNDTTSVEDLAIPEELQLAP